MILHVETNDLILDRISQDIATSIVKLACSMKGESSNVNILNIILRTDNKTHSKKDHEVDTHLKELCKEKNIFFIDNTNKNKVQHLNKDKLYFNKRGYNSLSSTFISE